ncbi:MAG: SDR family NAD(P)-dependent oxidoreductase [Sphingomonadales bacterium]|nr:SDR family NAD(P)-dependent oxidoreductase [Sphingomonadales bacterium]
MIPALVPADGVWFVTGSASGFGRALVEALLARGGRVVATARKPEMLDDLRCDNLLAVRLEVTDAGERAAALAAARARFGGIDALVNNAGYGDIGTIEEVPEASARALMETNYFATLALVQAVIPEMRARGSGRIVNVGSVAGQIGFPAVGAYAASKFAVAGMTESLAAEMKGFGIGVTLAELGPFATNFARAMGVTPPGAQYDMAAMSKEAGNSEWRGGDDPARGAAALLRAVCGEDPPVRIVLGQQGLDVVDLHDARRAAARETWRAVSGLRLD